METKILDIVNFIEKNPLSRLSHEYQSRLLNKIKDNFAAGEHQLFVTSFYCFLNYDTKKDFIIDLDNVWKWLGFTRKDSSKKLLEKHFIQNIDYIIKKISTEVEMSKAAPPIGGAGLNKEQIMLSVNTFKKLCLKSNTKKADEIHDYYIKLEELLQETLNEQTEELRFQLEEKEETIQNLNKKTESLSKHVVRRFNHKYNTGNCLYIISSTEIKDKVKIGITTNINYRISDLSTGSPYYFEVIEIFYNEFNALLEKSIKEIFAKYRISVNCEWYEISIIEKIKEFVKEQIELYEKYKDNSNIYVISDIEEDIQNIMHYENSRTCRVCDNLLSLNSFFCIDKKDKIYTEDCISCYEKENGESKKCSSCNKIKTIHEFVVDKTKKDGHTYECKICRNKSVKKRKNIIVSKNANLGKKKCTSCNNFEDLKMFYKFETEEEIKYSDECKKCYCKKNGESKICFTCKEIKNLKNFTKVCANIDGHSCYCKDCMQQKRDIIKEIKKESEDPNKNKNKCTKCETYLNPNMFFKSFNDNKETIYHDECMGCFTPSSLQCTRCLEIKLRECFSKDKHKRTGHRTICKVCTNKKKF